MDGVLICWFILRYPHFLYCRQTPRSSNLHFSRCPSHPTYRHLIPFFSPSSANVRANAYWFMNLVFSLSVALLATLVQRWVRDYMHVFQ
ncbi:hypothetical protein EDB87DRAFT_1614018 [Lactarius vividus]|nr:hypothetical protein EDB87DRAFT_1614018 [Lactarius vividus]